MEHLETKQANSRIETGALKINDDWAGLFIRGDDCFHLLTILKKAKGFGVSRVDEWIDRIEPLLGI